MKFDFSHLGEAPLATGLFRVRLRAQAPLWSRLHAEQGPQTKTREALSHVRQLPVSLFCPNCGKVHRLVAKDGRLADNLPLTKPEARHPAGL